MICSPKPLMPTLTTMFVSAIGWIRLRRDVEECEEVEDEKAKKKVTGGKAGAVETTTATTTHESATPHRK
jgi:hypothetical protein